jgi:acetyltransferase-like isoleucine patch superfamily enzyme
LIIKIGNRVVTRLSRYKAFIHAYKLIGGIVSKVLWVLGNVMFQLRVQNKGDGCVCHWSSEIKSPENLFLGNYVVVGPNVTIGAEANVLLEDYVRVSKGVVIESGSLDIAGKLPYAHISKPISIGKGAWLCTNAIILGGVTIGAGAVVSAGAVVTKDVARNSIVAGVPASVIGCR